MRALPALAVALLLAGCIQASPGQAPSASQSSTGLAAATAATGPTPFDPALQAVAAVHVQVSPWGSEPHRGYQVRGTLVLTNRLDEPIQVLRALPLRGCPYGQDVQVLDPAGKGYLPADFFLSYDCAVIPLENDDVVPLAPGESIALQFITRPYVFNQTSLVAVTYDPTGPGVNATVPRWSPGPITAWAWVDPAKDLAPPSG